MHQRTPIRAGKHLGAYSVQLNDASSSATMAETQEATLNNVKTIGECNQSMMESMMTMLQSIQTQNLKIERRVGGLESEVRSLRSDMTKMADGRRSGETTTTKPHGHPEVNKEVPDMVELERRLMSTKLDVLMTTQGNSSKKINQLVKEVQVLKATDGDMSEKLSGLIRCSAHGSNTERQAVTLEGLKAITERQAVTLEDVKVNTEQQVTELSTVKDIIEKVLPQKVKDIMKEELKVREPIRYRVRRDFNSDIDYGRYVEKNVREGKKVRYRCGDGYAGLAIGDVGKVLKLTDKHVWVDFSRNINSAGVLYHDIELLD